MRATLVFSLLLLALPAWAADTDPPQVEHTAAPSHDAETPYVVEVKFTDPSGIFEPALLYRVGAGAFERVALEADGEIFRGSVPESILVDGARLEYYVEAYDQEGNGPARMGDEDAPLVVVVRAKAPEPKPEPVEPKPVVPEPVEPPEVPPQEGSSAGLWIGVGVATVVVLAAGAAAGWYYFLREDVPAEVQLQITGPSPVGAP